MSAQTIYNALRTAGLSHAGACGLMGNMYCESLLQSNNVENRCPISDEEYTSRVDNGVIPLQTFKSDAYGYGLCQWTYYTRKAALYQYAKQKGVSIADEVMQVEFCIKELQDYPSLLSLLKTTDDIYTAALKVCTEYERPAVNNTQTRFNAALQYDSFSWDGQGAQATGASTSTATPAATTLQSTESCEISVRMVRNGDLGRDVYLLQCGLNDIGYSCGKADGIFGPKTEAAVKSFQSACNLEPTGIATADVWQVLYQ